MRTILVLGLVLTSLFAGESMQGLGSVTYCGNAGATGALAYIYDSDGDMTGDDPFPVAPTKPSQQG